MRNASGESEVLCVVEVVEQDLEQRGLAGMQ